VPVANLLCAEASLRRANAYWPCGILFKHSDGSYFQAPAYFKMAWASGAFGDRSRLLATANDSSGEAVVLDEMETWLVASIIGQRNIVGFAANSNGSRLPTDRFGRRAQLCFLTATEFAG